MPETTNLFRGFNLRFSMTKKQHLDVLIRWDEEAATGRKSRTQIIVDALEEHYKRLDNPEGTQKQMTYLQAEDLEQIKNEIRMEMYRELARFFMGGYVGNTAGGNILSELRNGTSQNIDAEENNGMEGLGTLTSDEAIMDRVMEWSG